MSLEVVLAEHVSSPSEPVCGAVAEIPLLKMLDEVEARQPHLVVLDDGFKRISPFILGIVVRRLARAFVALSPPGPVGIMLPEGATTVIACLAAMASGRDCVVLDDANAQASGCTAIAVDPDEPAPLCDTACVAVDVLLCCRGTYAAAWPPLPDILPAQVAIRIGSVRGERVALSELVPKAGPRSPARGPAAWPRSLGEAVAKILLGETVLLGAQGPAIVKIGA